MKNIQGLALEFYLNDKFIQITVAPDVTALHLIREQLGFTGAKEVCSEGDCGACTIAFGSWQDGKFVYHALNSCILPAARLHGCHVITAEGLAADNKLHLIQEMMLKHHAVQCGYCTAGMIMSMFCLFVNKRDANEQDILTALEGNLCRCTGYKPIYEAAQAAGQAMANNADEFAACLPAYAAHIQQKIKNIGVLKPIACVGTVADKLEAYYLPKTLAELFELMSKNVGNFKIFNGGTDLMVLANIHKIIPKCFIDISQIKELNFVHEENNKILIGGAVTLDQLLHSSQIQQKLPTLHHAITRMSDTQIRNIATLAGNVANASPIGDSICVLMGLGAALVLISKQGERRVAIEDFYRDYRVTSLNPSTEVISKIEVPCESGCCSSFEKTSKRISVDVSTVNSTIFLKKDDNGIVANCRIAFGGVAKYAILAKKSSAFLLGKKITTEVIAQVAQLAAAEFNTISDVRGSAEYRKQLIYNHIVKQLNGML